jgi:signal transduction histidine kinase
MPIDDGFQRRTGPAYVPFAVFTIGGLGSSILLLLHKFRRATGLARLQLQYVLAGTILSVVGCVTTNLIVPLVTGRSTYSLIGPLLLPPFVLLVAHAIIRHRLMDLRLAIHRSLISVLASLFSATPIVGFMVVFWDPVFTSYEDDYLALTLVSLLVASLLVPPAKTLMSTLLNRYVYRPHADFQLTVRRASKRLTQLVDLRTLLSFISGTVADTIQAEGVCIYLVRGAKYASVSRKLSATSVSLKTPELLNVAICEELAIRKDLILCDEASVRSSPRSVGIHSELSSNNWALILPLLAEDVVIGAIAVGPKLSGDPFYSQDLDLLMTLAHQAGIAIKNSQLYTQVVLANEYIQNIVATIESGVVAVDAEGSITMFNPAAELLTGISETTAKNFRLDNLPAELADLIGGSLLDGQQRTKPEMKLCVGDVVRPVICTTGALRDPMSNILGAVAVFSDLTPLKQLESERQRAERLAYFEILASSLAHEIKNPLVAIKTFAQLISRRHRDENFVAEFSRVVTREIGRMERLVERLRCLSQPANRPKQLVDLREPIGHALEFFGPAFEEKRIVLKSVLGTEPRTIVGDPSELEELFSNLLMNAYDATLPGGMVSITVKATGSETTIVEVADTGPGIPAEMLQHIFDPFVTSKARGSGLGLTISAGIAKGHGGRLSAANRPEGGALLTVEFRSSDPINPPEYPSATSRSQSTTPPYSEC